ncbi:mucin-20 [Carlito syrichta]|uniref:Mucin-20 n=1 Tax=Carlito syrichta TaxID=1868482 RepID=A0A3Q0E7R3_CARSF|nr:mucin-20 [Carlito syrichta]
MVSLWGLVLPLFFCCWEEGVSGSSAGTHTGRHDTLMTSNEAEVPYVYPGVRMGSEGAIQTTGFAETSAPGHVSLEAQTLSTENVSRILILNGIFPEAETSGTKTISPATGTRALTKTIPSKFMGVITTPREMSATSHDLTGTTMTTVETITRNDPEKTIFETLCTEDSSEEARRIVTGIVTLAHPATDTEGLSSESSSSSDGSAAVLTTSQATAPDIIIPSKAVVAYSVTHIEVTNCSITETETTAIISGVSDPDHSRTEGARALSTSETLTSPDSTEAKPYITEETISAETLATASATGSVGPDATVENPLPTVSTTERVTSAAKATTPDGILVTISMNPLEDISAHSVESPSYLEDSGAVPVSTEAGSTVGKEASSARSSISVYSPSEVATIKNATSLETSTTESTTNGPFPFTRSPLFSVQPTTVNSSRGTNITLAKNMTSAKTLMKPPKATPTSVWTKWTIKVTAVLYNGETSLDEKSIHGKVTHSFRKFCEPGPCSAFLGSLGLPPSLLTLEGGCWPHMFPLIATAQPSARIPGLAILNENWGNSSSPSSASSQCTGSNRKSLCEGHRDSPLTELISPNTGTHTSRQDTLMTSNEAEVPYVYPGVRMGSEGAIQTTGFAETSAPGHVSLEAQTLSTENVSRILIPNGTISEEETRETKTIYPATGTRMLTKTMPSKFTVVITTPREMSATSRGLTGTAMTTIETATGSDLEKTMFETLCTEDSSEEARRIVTGVVTLAHPATDTEGLSSESSSSSDGSAAVLTTSQATAPDIIIPSKAVVAYSVTHIEVTNCSITETETTAIISGVSDPDHSRTEGARALSTSETLTSPDSTEAKPYITEETISAETLATASATGSVGPDATVENPLPTVSITERVTSAAKATTPDGILVTISMNPLEDISAHSVESPSYLEDSGAVPVSTEAGSTVGKEASSAGSSISVYSPSEVATIKNAISSETSITNSTTNGPFPFTRSPLPSVQLTTANTSRGPNITLAKNTTSAKTPMKRSVATPTRAWTRWTTEVTTGEDGGFLLLRLNVASPEDLTDPRVAERLMQRLHRELHVHMPPTQVSLLRVRRR